MKVEEFTQLVVIFVAFQTYGILASYINIICSHQTLCQIPTGDLYSELICYLLPLPW